MSAALRLVTSSTSAAARAAAHPNPFDVNRPYEILMRITLAVPVVLGFGIGVLLVVVFGLGLPLLLPYPQLAQAHGQIQLLGFTLPFVLAVGLQLFPRFLGAPIPHPYRVVAAGAATAAGVTIRLFAQPMEPGLVRSVLLIVTALLVPTGVVLGAIELGGMRQRSVQPLRGPSADWQLFVVAGLVSLFVAVGLHTWGMLELAAGNLMVPMALDEATIHLELDGFATCMVLGVASRVFGRFLLLRTRPSLDRLLARLAGAYAVGLALVVTGWLSDVSLLVAAGYILELAVLVVWVWLIGLYDRPSRASGMPHVTAPTRRWFRLAFALLLLGVAMLGAASAGVGFPTATGLSAARHAVTQGFLLVLMTGMAARLLPIYSADALRHRWTVESAVALLLLGALLRSVSEMVGGYAGVAGPLTALGGTLSAVGFTLFAVGLWSSLGRLPGKTRQAEIQQVG